MTMLSSPKRILITGASRGIGRTTAELLARAGHRVVIAARDADALGEVVRTIASAGGQAEALPMDVTDDESVARAIATMLAKGPLDALVNNAGTCDQAEFLLQASALQQAEMALNYFGALRVTRAVLPHFIARGAGTIVNVSSLLGAIGSRSTANYSASKAALEAWSHALRAEVAHFGVRVSVFVAPHTATEMGRAVRFEGVPSLPVAYTANALVCAIDRAPRVHVASPVYWLLLFFARLFPSFMEKRVSASARPAEVVDRRAICLQADSQVERSFFTRRDTPLGSTSRVP